MRICLVDWKALKAELQAVVVRNICTIEKPQACKTESGEVRGVKCEAMKVNSKGEDDETVKESLFAFEAQWSTEHCMISYASVAWYWRIAVRVGEKEC
jgi:hypothetical protein